MTLTDILTIIAIFLGPIVSVQINQYLETKRWATERKLRIFKTLISTRSTSLDPRHIEALNMIDVEFDPKKAPYKDVVEAWKLYLSHLHDTQYPKESWGARKADLMIDLLNAMAKSLNYDFDKSQIKSASYYPRGYGEYEDDQYLIRKGTLEVLSGERPIHITVRNQL